VVNKTLEVEKMIKVKHRLPILMAERDIKSVVQLSEKTGIDYRTLYNFYSYVHKKLDPQLIVILCQTLRCEIGDLLYLKEVEEEKVS
jgi:putative transcriptional regulator